jgi:hypothetical protein
MRCFEPQAEVEHRPALIKSVIREPVMTSFLPTHTTETDTKAGLELFIGQGVPATDVKDHVSQYATRTWMSCRRKLAAEPISPQNHHNEPGLSACRANRPRLWIPWQSVSSSRSS